MSEIIEYIPSIYGGIIFLCTLGKRRVKRKQIKNVNFMLNIVLVEITASGIILILSVFLTIAFFKTSIFEQIKMVDYTVCAVFGSLIQILVCIIMIQKKAKELLGIKEKVYIVIFATIIHLLFLFYMITEAFLSTNQYRIWIGITAIIIVIAQAFMVISFESIKEVKYKIYVKGREKAYISLKEPWEEKGFINIELICKRGEQSIVSLPKNEIEKIKTIVKEK